MSLRAVLKGSNRWESIHATRASSQAASMASTFVPPQTGPPAAVPSQREPTVGKRLALMGWTQSRDWVRACGSLERKREREPLKVGHDSLGVVGLVWGEVD